MPGASPPPRDAGAAFYPQRGDKVGVVVEWIDGTVAMFVARSRIRGPSALAVKLAPGPVVYGGGPKLAYFLGVESIQFGVEVVVERLLLGATGVPGFVAQVGYMVYQYADKTSDAAELLSIAAGDGTFVVLNSVVAHLVRETGGSELYTLEGAPALEQADGSQVVVPVEHGVTFTAGGEIGTPSPAPVPPWAESGGLAVRDTPRGDLTAVGAQVALAGTGEGAPVEPGSGIEPIAPIAPGPSGAPSSPPVVPAVAGGDASWIATAVLGTVLGVLGLVLITTMLRRRRVA